MACYEPEPQHASGYYNHVLASLQDPRAFRLQPLHARALARELIRSGGPSAEAAVSRNSPYAAHRAAHQLSNAQSTPQVPGRRPRYSDFRHFAHYLSSGRYVPTRPLLELLPTDDLDAFTKEELFLSLPCVNPATLRRTGSRGSAGAHQDTGRPIFFRRSHVTNAYSEGYIYKLAHHLIRWAAASPDFPPGLHPPGKPPGAAPEGARPIIQAVVDAARAGYNTNPPYAFYAKVLIPHTLEHAHTIAGIASFAALGNDEDDDVDPAHRCPICLDSLARRPSSALPCLHGFHADCLQGLQGRSCPVCRAPF